jgi:hypothetical protein
VNEGRGQARAAYNRPGLKMFHPDFNLKLFEPVRNTLGRGANLIRELSL